MSYYFSKTTNGFYLSEIHGENRPNDCVEITEQQHRDLLNSQASGKLIYGLDDGTPSTKDYVPSAPTWDEIRTQRDSLLAASDWTDLPNTPLSNKQAWLDYRTALRDVPQTYSEPSQVVWPTKPS